MEEISSCPVCGTDHFADYLQAVDHTVSHETFSIRKCPNCTLLITTPRPIERNLARYYESPDYISHTNAGKTIVDKIYRTTRLYALKWKWSLVTRQKRNGIRVLDYGCGTGAFLKKCKDESALITGVEPSKTARKIAQEITEAEIHDSLAKVVGSYDVITLWHVLEHVPDLTKTLEELRLRLDENGTMFIAVPNHWSFDAKKYKHLWAGYDVPRHLWHFNPNAMNTLMKSLNMTIVETIPMKMDSYYVSMLSEKYTRQKATMLTFLNGMITGLKSNLVADSQKYSSLIYVIKK